MSWFSSFTNQLSEIAESTKNSVTEATASLSETVQNLDAQKVSDLVKDIYVETTKEFLLGSTGSELEVRSASRLERAVKLKLVPWKVYDESKSDVAEELQTRVLNLSEVEDTFLVSAPDDTVFEFNFHNLLPFAHAALAEDKNLSQQRYVLVPKRVEEDAFWRNYFYRVQLVRNQLELPVLSDDIIREYIVQVPDVPDTEAYIEKEGPAGKVTEKEQTTETQVESNPSSLKQPIELHEAANDFEDAEEEFVTDMISQEDLRNMRKELGIKQPKSPVSTDKSDHATTESNANDEEDEILNDLLADMDSGDIDEMNDEDIEALMESGV